MPRELSHFRLVPDVDVTTSTAATASSDRRLAIALHGIQPRAFGRCALIRDWLDDHGVARVTLLVVPAPDLHPFHERCPELADWLRERVQSGDAIAQQGLHLQGSSGRRRERPPMGDLSRLTGDEARRAVASGRRVFKLAGLEPQGFVAPNYAYGPALRRAVAPAFLWWAGRNRIVRASERSAIAPAFDLHAHSFGAGARSATMLRIGLALGSPLVRLDLYPDDLDRRPGRMVALNAALKHLEGHRAVTYDDVGSTAA